jgi:hypothetical protein
MARLDWLNRLPEPARKELNRMLPDSSDIVAVRIVLA